tara:strand:+ start:156505 stop:157854 length:1350 start_codon:yes stop_codon:yes gene_type:complete
MRKGLLMRSKMQMFLEKVSLLITMTIIIIGYQNCGEISAQKVEAFGVGEVDNSSGQVPGDGGGDEEEEPSLPENPEVMKPLGVYSSNLSGSNTNNPVVKHEQSNGVLIRVTWNEVEPRDDQFDFSSIDEKIAIINQNKGNKDFYYTLAISAGCGERGDSGYPAWMDGRSDIAKWTIKFRSNLCQSMPKGWDDNYLAELEELASELAKKYKADKNLKMIYVPQATGNGIEGHFNGNFNPNDRMDWSPLTSQGLSKETWKYAMKEAAVIFAQAFEDRAVALELHTIIDRADIPLEAINELYDDPRTGKRVGAAMWWLFGKDEEQELAQGMTDFRGDVYGQVGANSTQPLRVGECDYSSLLDMAVQMGMRYIEPWDKEFKEGGSSGLDTQAYNVQRENFRKFNEYVLARFVRGENPAKPTFEKAEPLELDPDWDPNVNTKKSCPGRYYVEEP